MSHSVYLSCPHATGDCIHPDDEPCPVMCGTGEDSIEITLAYEKPDYNYGADADGNRGIYVAGYWYPEDSVPEHCPACGTQFTADEYVALCERLDKLVADYDDGSNDYDDRDAYGFDDYGSHYDPY